MVCATEFALNKCKSLVEKKKKEIKEYFGCQGTQGLFIKSEYFRDQDFKQQGHETRYKLKVPHTTLYFFLFQDTKWKVILF